MRRAWRIQNHATCGRNRRLTDYWALLVKCTQHTEETCHWTQHSVAYLQWMTDSWSKARDPHRLHPRVHLNPYGWRLQVIKEPHRWFRCAWSATRDAKESDAPRPPSSIRWLFAKYRAHTYIRQSGESRPPLAMITSLIKLQRRNLPPHHRAMSQNHKS